MKKLLQTLFFFLLAIQICFGQWSEQSGDSIETAWVRHYEANMVASSDQASDLALDSFGNLYATGMSGSDIVTIKYNTNGDTVWTRRYDGPGMFWGGWLPVSIAVDLLGNVYVAGGTNTYFGDFLTIKYSTDGNILWIRTYNGPADGGDYVTGIVVDEEFNVYVIGPRTIYEGQWQVFKPYIIKYDEYGNVPWQEEIESNLSGIKNIAIALDPDENIIVTEFSRTLKLDRITGNIIWLNNYFTGYGWNQCLAVDQFGNAYINKVLEQPAYHYEYLTIKYTQNGSIAWLTNHDGPGQDVDAPSAIDVDSLGNVYVTGSSNGDYITSKFDNSGNILWEKSYIGPNTGEGRSCAIKVDNLGNVYVTGTDQNDFATIKYDSNGNVIWVQRYDGLGHNTDNATSLILDANGSLYVTGGSVGGISDFDYTTIKYTLEGDTLWCKRYNGIPNSYDRSTSLALDESGNAYVTGVSNASGSGEDYATVKFNSSGDLIWVSRYNGSLSKRDWPTSIAVDPDQNVYVTGGSENSDTSSRYATLKYNLNGNLLWQKFYSSTSGMGGGATFLTKTPDDDVLVTGSSDNENVTLKYNSDGNTIWVSEHHFPGERYDATSMIVDASGNSYIAGWTGVDWWHGSTRNYATIKFNSDGDTVWTRLYDNEDGWDEARSIVCDETGNAYVTGQSNGNYATIKYDNDGDTFWIKNYNGPNDGYDMASVIVLDSDGNVFVTGTSEGVGTGLDYTTIKYNGDGEPTGVNRYNGLGNSDDEVVSMTIDSEESIYIVGKSRGLNGDFDIVTIKYTNNGDVEWISRFDASDVSAGLFADDYPCAIKVSSYNAIYVAGSSEWPNSGKAIYTLIRYNQATTQVANETNINPTEFALEQNYPNPFNPTTTFRYSIPTQSKVIIKVFDILGNEIATLVDEEKPAGTYNVEFTIDNLQLSSGVYFYQLRAGNYVITKKMLLLK